MSEIRKPDHQLHQLFRASETNLSGKNASTEKSIKKDF
jgi:hypothetical protein